MTRIVHEAERPLTSDNPQPTLCPRNRARFLVG